MDEKKDFISMLTLFMSQNRVYFRDFAYVLGIVVLLFVIEDILFPTGQLLYYSLSALAVASAIFGLRKVVASAFHIALKERIWTSGIIFSAVATLLLAATGLPLPVLLLESPEHSRMHTLAGLHKDEIKIHERWSVSMFSTMSILAISMLFLFAFMHYKQTFLLQSAFALLSFSFINFMPFHKFEGALLSYHNIALYGILVLIMLVLVVLSALSGYGTFYFALGTFVTFCAVGLFTQRLHLW